MPLTAGLGTGGSRPGVCTSTTRPASPFEGQIIYETDTDVFRVYNETGWISLNPVNTNRNKIINGGFDVWQRGTSYTIVAGTYGAADRWIYWHNGSTAGTQTVSRQAFTAGAAPVAGYEAEFFQRITTTTIGSGQTVIDTWQRIEGVRTLAGQTVNVSFWAKTSGTFGIISFLEQNFGSGGSSTVTTTVTGLNGVASSGSWTRYTGTVTLPSISGKTIGANNYLMLIIRFLSPTNGATFDLWGVQLEAGSVATPFEIEDIQTTLNKCFRYFERYNQSEYFQIPQSPAFIDLANRCEAHILYSRKRAAPTLTVSNVAHLTCVGITQNLSVAGTSFDTFVGTGLYSANIFVSGAGINTFTVFGIIFTNASSGWLAISAEL